jgi:hypothetical protein
MPQEYDRPSIGATSGSQPTPSPPAQEHRPFTTPGSVELANHQRIGAVSNNVDILRMRVEKLEDIVRVLLESSQKQIDAEGYDAKGVLERYIKHSQDFTRMQRQQQELEDRNRRY